MKSRKFLTVSLCGAVCLSLAGVTYAGAQAADMPKTIGGRNGANVKH